ncbi:FK506-binding protein 15 isoform X2 [Engraulis encrasicolus]|uniref:FK506-binding protein 15 isoform X2 n=1 Tax=Engraulis encrasicolus TaxID=184585 RepID=UPI002FD20F2C
MFAYYPTDFLSRKSGAKLASLFSLDQAESQGNESFQFTAPKQPKKNTPTVAPTTGPPPPRPKAAPSPPSPPSAPSVMFVTAVYAFRFLNGQHVKQGKVGAAVLGNHGNKEYKILIYGSQQKPITSAKIHPGFTLTVQPGKYATFYDDQRQNWSLMFDSLEISADFCKQVCLAKWNADPSLETVMTQDLVLGEGKAAEDGDTVTISFTAWLLQNHTTGETFNSSASKDKLHPLMLGPSKGWEEGLLGMKGGAHRRLIIPPSRRTGPSGILNNAPRSSTLVLDVEVRQVCFGKDGTLGCPSLGTLESPPSSIPVEIPTPEASPPKQIHQSPQTQKVQQRAKSNSPNEKLERSSSAKARLITRMAKMGQPLLPFLHGAIPAQPDPSDSETEDLCDVEETHHATPPTVPASPSSSPPETPALNPVAVSSQIILARQMETIPPPVETTPVQSFVPYHTMLSTAHIQPMGFHTVPYPAPDVTSFLMSDVRQFSTEMRLDVGKVADKLEQLNAKVEKLQNHGSFFGCPSLSMDTAMIMHSIQRITQENTTLKQELHEKSNRIEEQNSKIGELIEQNQRCIERNSQLQEQKSNSFHSSGQNTHTRLLMAEQDKVRLVEELSSTTSLLCEVQQETSTLQQRATELQAKLTATLQNAHRQRTQISALETAVEELKAGKEQSQVERRKEKQKCKELQLQVDNLEEELQDLKADKKAMAQLLQERRRKWQQERERLLGELEEARQSGQQESDQLRDQLRRTRSATQNHSTEQDQANLEAEWQRRCDESLSSAREVHQRTLLEVVEQRDMLEETVSQLHAQIAEIQRRARADKQQLEIRLAELEQKLFEQSNDEATAMQLKWAMNRVFHSLKEEFDPEQTYTGSTVLKLALNTIKSVTLHFLADLNDIPAEADDEREEEDEEEKKKETNGTPTPHSNQDRKKDERTVKDAVASRDTRVGNAIVRSAVTNSRGESTYETTERSGSGTEESWESSSAEELFLCTLAKAAGTPTHTAKTHK